MDKFLGVMASLFLTLAVVGAFFLFVYVVLKATNTI